MEAQGAVMRIIFSLTILVLAFSFPASAKKPARKPAVQNTDGFRQYFIQDGVIHPKSELDELFRSDREDRYRKKDYCVYVVGPDGASGLPRDFAENMELEEKELLGARGTLMNVVQDPHDGSGCKWRMNQRLDYTHFGAPIVHFHCMRYAEVDCGNLDVNQAKMALVHDFVPGAWLSQQLGKITMEMLLKKPDAVVDETVSDDVAKTRSAGAKAGRASQRNKDSKSVK